MSSLFERVFIEGEPLTARQLIEADKDDFERVWRKCYIDGIQIQMTQEEAKKINARINGKYK